MAKKKNVYLCFVLDETGSMLVCKDATISGYNEYLQSLQGEHKGKVDFALTRFNSNAIKISESVPVSEAKELTAGSYQPVCLTPLYDAIMATISNTKAAVKRKKSVAVLCSIMTDGLENASQQYTRDDVFKAIKEQTEKGWTFTYLGANQDAWAVGITMGILKGNTSTYDTSKTKETLLRHSHATACFVSSTLRGAKTGDFYASKPDEEGSTVNSK